MKRFIAVILAVLYMGTSTGATIHMHYCMDKLTDWNLSHKSSKTCDNCGMEKDSKKDNGCCKDEHKFLKNDTEKATTASFLFLQTPGTAPLSSYIEFPVLPVSSITEENPVSNAPPQATTVAVYILNRTFLI